MLLKEKPSEVVHHSDTQSTTQIQSFVTKSSLQCYHHVRLVGFPIKKIGCEERNQVTFEELMELSLMYQAFSSRDMATAMLQNKPFVVVCLAEVITESRADGGNK